MSPMDLHEHLGQQGRIEKSSSMSNGNHLVVHRMEEQLRHRDMRDLAERVESILHHPGDGKQRVQFLPPIDCRCEPSLHDKSCRLHPRCKVDRDGCPERVAIEYQMLRRNAEN